MVLAISSIDILTCWRKLLNREARLQGWIKRDSLRSLSIQPWDYSLTDYRTEKRSGRSQKEYLCPSTGPFWGKFSCAQYRPLFPTSLVVSSRGRFSINWVHFQAGWDYSRTHCAIQYIKIVISLRLGPIYPQQVVFSWADCATILKWQPLFL